VAPWLQVRLVVLTRRGVRCSPLRKRRVGWVNLAAAACGTNGMRVFLQRRGAERPTQTAAAGSAGRGAYGAAAAAYPDDGTRGLSLMLALSLRRWRRLLGRVFHFDKIQIDGIVVYVLFLFVQYHG